MPASWDWVLLDSLSFVNNLSLSLKTDDPMNIALRRIFTEVTGKMMRYSGCSHGLHLLSNTSYQPNGEHAAFEVDHLYIDEKTRSYLSSALGKR